MSIWDDNLELLLPGGPNRLTWAWATVTSASPRAIRMDGEASPLAAEPDTLVSGLVVGERVRVHMDGSRSIIIGRAGGEPPQVGAIKTTTFTANGTFTPDPKMVFCHVVMCGGGGSGGQAAATGSGQRSASTGGSGACTAYGKFTKAQVGASQSVTVGLGGVQGDGGDTSLGSLMSAVGGLVGGNRGPSSGNWAGTINTPQGGNTATGEYLRVRGGRGAGSKGIAGVWAEGGDGGDTPLGHGGRGNASTGGDGGVGYGSGGGGVANGESSSAAWGGNGAVGIIIITEYLEA